MKRHEVPPKRQNIIVIASSTLCQAQQLVESCEYCNWTGAEIPFDWILDEITGSDSTVTDYIREAAAKCPNCRREIYEKTLVEPAK
jgi:hypothetical protein